MEYKLTTKGNKVDVSLVKNELVTKITKPEFSVSLARTGGQGAKGDTISNVFINENNDLVVEITSSSGVITSIVAGNLTEKLKLGELLDVTITNVSEGDYIAYDLATQSYKNHKLTTDRLTDFDNSNKQDGSVLVYNGTTEKYTATTQLNNPNTLIVGGNF
jgi:hypothetical protein